MKELFVGLLQFRATCQAVLLHPQHSRCSPDMEEVLLQQSTREYLRTEDNGYEIDK